MTSNSGSAAKLNRAKELLVAGKESGADLALLGGAAVALICASARDGGPLDRMLADVDFAGSGRQRRRIEHFAAETGLRPDEAFNRSHGDIRLRYLDADESHIDVFLDELRLCHVIRWRTPFKGSTLPLAELFLTKAQIVNLEAKDLGDLSALLIDHGDDLLADFGRLESLVHRDWGLWRTTRGSLESIIERGVGDAREVAAVLLTRWQGVHLSPRARARALVGDRMRWYEDPEEV